MNNVGDLIKKLQANVDENCANSDRHARANGSPVHGDFTLTQKFLEMAKQFNDKGQVAHALECVGAAQFVSSYEAMYASMSHKLWESQRENN